MIEFWNYKFDDTPDTAETFDELPLWSAPFGLLLLKHIELKPYRTVIDLGSGTGFPLCELAERLGPSCRCFGIDPWSNAAERTKKKIRNYGLGNTEIHEASGDNIPFASNTVDLIVSSLGLNNFANPDTVFKECSRVLKPGSRLALTTNLDGHWKEFYTVFENTLLKLGKESLVEKLNAEQAHRGTPDSISALFFRNGFRLTRHFAETYEMRFLDGTAFLNHHFIKLGWMSSWREIIPSQDRELVFRQLETDLNNHAERSGGIILTVPMAFIEGEKSDITSAEYDRAE